MIYVFLIAICILFVELVVLLNCKRDVSGIIGRSSETMRAISAPELGDNEKERILQELSTALMKLSLAFAAKFLLIIALLYIAYLGTVFLIPGLEEPIQQSFFSPIKLGLLVVVAMAYLRVRSVIFG